MIWTKLNFQWRIHASSSQIWIIFIEICPKTLKWMHLNFVRIRKESKYANGSSLMVKNSSITIVIKKKCFKKALIFIKHVGYKQTLLHIFSTFISSHLCFTIMHVPSYRNNMLCMKHRFCIWLISLIPFRDISYSNRRYV